MQAWTSWNLARFDVSAQMIEEMADALERTGLKALGWSTLQIDEGWESCDEYAGPHPGVWPKNFLTGCATPTPRDSRGWIVANQTKFPGGIKPLVDRLHARGFRVGIYTSASERACGGNWGSHGHERADAAAFAAWADAVLIFTVRTSLSRSTVEMAAEGFATRFDRGLGGKPARRISVPVSLDE